MFDHLDYWVVAALLALGFASGVWNAIAGGASFFTFPALLALGLPANVAHATSYVAVTPANFGSLATTGHVLRAAGRALGPMLAVTLAGAALGSWLLIISDPKLFEALVPALILAATGLFALGRGGRWRIAEAAQMRASGLGALFLVSIYGGYFGSGTGIILLALAQALGYSSFAVANAVKNALAVCFAIVGLAIFSAGGLIAWPEALLLISSCTIGGVVGGALTQYVNPVVFRRVIIGFGFGLSIYFAWTLWL